MLLITRESGGAVQEPKTILGYNLNSNLMFAANCYPWDKVLGYYRPKFFLKELGYQDEVKNTYKQVVLDVR
jgi:hypothetical protein